MGNEFSILEQRINFQITMIHRLYFLRIGSLKQSCGEGKEALGSSAVASQYISYFEQVYFSFETFIHQSIGFHEINT